MLGINVKRGVASTLERVFNASGNRFDKLEILWSGKTAGIIHRRSSTSGVVNAKVLFPALDETKFVPKETFNNLIGYALHELGHAWYTDNESWDKARDKHGSFVSNLINGLEDPRIERLVIESGRAPNARVLFENLVNSILKRDGYVKPDDKKNIPFLLAVEGRRLNGYAIIEPSIVDASPWATHIRWALRKAQTATNTKAIVKIAVELFKRIREQEQPKPEEKPQDGPDNGQPLPQDGEQDEPQDGEQDGQDEPQDSEPGDKPQDGPEGSDEGSPSDESDDGPEGDSEGESDGEPVDGNPGDSGDDGDGDANDESDDSDDGQPSSGKADESFDGGRDVEPSSFIADELGEHRSSWSDVSRPAVGKPNLAKFEWR